MFHKAKIDDADNDLQSGKRYYYVGWNGRHVEGIPFLSARVREWQSEELLSSDAAGACTEDAPLNADTVAGETLDSDVQDSAQFPFLGASAGKLQRGNRTDLWRCYEFWHLPLSTLYIVCSNCQKFVYFGSLCMGVEDKVANGCFTT